MIKSDKIDYSCEIFLFNLLKIIRKKKLIEKCILSHENWWHCYYSDCYVNNIKWISRTKICQLDIQWSKTIRSFREEEKKTYTANKFFVYWTNRRLHRIDNIDNLMDYLLFVTAFCRLFDISQSLNTGLKLQFKMPFKAKCSV